MNLSQQKLALSQLTDSAHIKADHALLKSKNPRSRVARVNPTSSEKIVWELLKSGVTPSEIKANRVGQRVLSESAAPPARAIIPEGGVMDNLKKKVIQTFSQKSKKNSNKKKKNTRK